MGTRPLRQYGEGELAVVVDDDLGGVGEPWARHRRRFGAALRALRDDQWSATTRCDGWDVKDVVNHLVTADSFWVVSLQGALAGAPTTYLRGFDPTTSPEALVDPMRAMPSTEVLDRFDAGTTAFTDVVAALDAGDGAGWTATGESPVGNLPARLVLAHALWDSWLHERDVCEPLGIDVATEPDELAICAWYTLVMGAVQGGLLDDDAAVGPGLDAPIDVTLVFEDLPDLPLRVVVDAGVRITRGERGGVAAGSAVTLVDATTGRTGGGASLDGLPDALAAQLARARQVL